MKRHPSLQDLSREHHLMLLHARELRWVSKGSGDLLKACREFLDYWEKRGYTHFKQEEEKLFPYCERCQDWEKTEAVDLVFKQHEEIQSLIRRLQFLMKTNEDIVPVSSALSDLLNRHIRHEERIVFEFIQNTLTERELEVLERFLKSPG